MKIRLLDSSDAPALTAFFAGVSADAVTRRFFTPFPLTPESAADIADRNRRGCDRYFAAFEDGRVVGFGMLRGWDEGYDVPAFGVVVAPAERGAGIGRRLLRFGVDEARRAGARKMMLKVHRENSGARRLYASEGFVFEEPEEGAMQLKATRDLV